MKRVLPWIVCSALIIMTVGCTAGGTTSNPTAPPASTTPPPSSTPVTPSTGTPQATNSPRPTLTSPPTPTPQPTNTPQPTRTPPATATRTPTATADPEVVRYLRGVESILRHSARVVPELALGLGHVCPERYIIAFPYREPDRRGGMNPTIVGLPRAEDGTVMEGEHKMIWHWGDAGLWPDRWQDIYLYDRSTDGLLRVEFLMKQQDATWWVGLISGHCPGDDLVHAGVFPISDPQDYVFSVTEYSAEGPFDFWIQDVDQLKRYRWEPWTATLLWTLQETPGTLVGVEWDDASPDLTGDGLPDLVVQWDVSGELVRWLYAADGQKFVPVGAVSPE